MTINITLEKNARIEPGHQVIVLPISPEGMALARLLLDREEIATMPIEPVQSEPSMRINHTHSVDQKIVALIDLLAHIRFSAPDLVQMTMPEAEAAPVEKVPA